MGSTEAMVALVTGAGSGIARATARVLAARGVNLVVADINEGTLADVTRECEPSAAKVLSVVFDQRSTESVESMVAQAVDTFGRIDFAANIAGVFPIAPILSTTDEVWQDVIDTNLKGTFALSRALGRQMLTQDGGAIVNIASGAATNPSRGLGAYAASKAGIIGFSRVLALELAPSVRVNVVAPGPTRTRGVDEGAEADPASQVVIEAIPLGRWAEPDDIAGVIAFLATPEASYLTGQVIHVNGGRFMP
jgi:NAD(P)-dependent dehydrogenase (short-subunit alcohol dehydrogenase family)